MSREAALKDYVEVNVRIMKFYEKYPEGRILTEIVKWENDVIVMKATAYRDGTDVPASTGFAYEKEGSSFINKTSALENCETSAVGRCLAILGFEVKKSIASREEVANAQLQQATIKTSGDGFGELTFNPTNDYKITEKQFKRLLAISNKAGYDKEKLDLFVIKKYNKKSNELNKTEYDYIISKLEAKIHENA